MMEAVDEDRLIEVKKFVARDTKRTGYVRRLQRDHVSVLSELLRVLFSASNGVGL